MADPSRVAWSLLQRLSERGVSASLGLAYTTAKDFVPDRANLRLAAEAACRAAKKQGGGCGVVAGQGLVTAPRHLDGRTAYLVGAAPAVAEMELASQAAELFRFDSRLTVPLALELLLVLDELRANQHAIEVTSYGSRRVCRFCSARSEAWAVDAREAAKLPIQHAAPCGGRLVDSLWQRFPVIAELAQHERRSLRSPTATALDACLRELTRERIYGCRSGAELAAQLARGAALPPTPYRVGVGATPPRACGAWPRPPHGLSTPMRLIPASPQFTVRSKSGFLYPRRGS